MDHITYDSEYIQGTHPEWKRHIKRWRFYQDSYLGGADYKKGDYLTHYVFENPEEYQKRVNATPLDNHSKNIIHIYNSFLFSRQPYRDLGVLEMDPSMEQFMRDADLEGRSFDSFMREANIMASIYGNVWIFIDKPATSVATRAEELAEGIRPYCSIVSPENVLDWEYKRQPNGNYKLSYMKLLENNDTDITVYRMYYEDRTEVVEYDKSKDETKIIETYENTIGVVPAVCLYASRSPIRGIGVSDLADIADLQRGIYDEYSEAQQLMTISNHPSLVKTPEVNASAGAGAIISVPENTDPGLKPYLLQPNSQSLDGIHSSIKNKIDAIDRIAHMGGVRATASRSVSGVALQVENQLLNAKLIEKADNLELAEEQIWKLWAQWQGLEYNGTIDYPGSFNLRDKVTELEAIKKIVDMGVAEGRFQTELKRLAAEIIFDDASTVEYIMGSTIDPDGPTVGAMGMREMEHPVLDASNFKTHIKEMIDQGYTLAEIEALHPEITELMLQDTVSNSLAD